MAQNCPRCGNEADDLLPLDTGLRVALQEQGKGDLPESVCPTCYEGLTSEMSQGVKLRINLKQREKNKAVLWKSRVNLIKQARSMMSQKSYTEAAVAYEKYLKVLEVVYDKPAGELGPDIFNKSSRSKELTVLASAYWDLMRIYDTSPQFADRMSMAAKKLSEFLPYSPIYPDIIKKAETFVKTCNNQKIVKSFLRSTKAKKGHCFIATSAFMDPDHPYVCELRYYRDQVLAKNFWGRLFVHVYYLTSPPLAAILSRSKPLRAATRRALICFLTFRLK